MTWKLADGQHDQSLHRAAPTCTTMSEADLVRDFEQARRRHQAMWAAGDYTRVAEQLTGVSAAVVEAAASPHRRREASDHSS